MLANVLTILLGFELGVIIAIVLVTLAVRVAIGRALNL